MKPLSYMLKTSNVYHFDEEKGYERELKYLSKQRTPFVDEMFGDQRLEHIIIFRKWHLFVEKKKKLHYKNYFLYITHTEKIYEEHNPVAIAEDKLNGLS